MVPDFPFEQATKAIDTNYKLIAEEKNDEFWAKLDPESKFSDDFKNLVLSMLSYDPEKRPTAQEIKEHPWM